MSEPRIDAYRNAERRWWEECGVDPIEHFISVAKYGIKVRLLEIGDGDPALFVHGSPSGASIWSPLAARLKGARCLLLDRPGCGLSESVDYTTMTIGDLKELAKETMLAVLDFLEIEQTALVANSHGGAWALWFAAAHGDRVTRIVCDGAPGYVEGLKMDFMSFLRLPLMGQLMASIKASPKSVRSNFKQMGHKTSVEDGRLSETFFNWCTSLFNDTGTWRNEIGGQTRALLRGGGLAELTYSQEFLRRIVQPTLVLWGECDNFAAVSCGKRFVESLPNATFMLFPQSGHLPWLDNPEAHAKRISEFLTHSPGNAVTGSAQSPRRSATATTSSV